MYSACAADVIYIPIWRDLKPNLIFIVNNFIQYLHSNMERFKVFRPYQSHNVCLYLHSNMERFKDIVGIISGAACHIYIPIWRDLKL